MNTIQSGVMANICSAVQLTGIGRRAGKNTLAAGYLYTVRQAVDFRSLFDYLQMDQYRGLFRNYLKINRCNEHEL